MVSQRFDQSFDPYQDYKHNKQKYTMRVVVIVQGSSLLTEYKL